MNYHFTVKLTTLLLVLLLMPFTLLACGGSEDKPASTQISGGPTPSLMASSGSTASTTSPGPTPVITSSLAGSPAASSGLPGQAGSPGAPPSETAPDLTPFSPETKATPAVIPDATPAPLTPPTQGLPASAMPGGSENFYAGETAHFIKEPFLSYWQKYGGASVFGNPLSESYTQNGLEVQLFEHALLEYHPELAGQPSEIQIGFLGRQLAQAQQLPGANPAFAPVPARNNTPAESYFPQTGHTLVSPFKAFWESNNLLKFLGYPISQPLELNSVTIQYFERGRLEYDQTSKTVIYSNSGDLLIAASGWLKPQKFQLNLKLPQNATAVRQGQTFSVELTSQDGWQPGDLQGKFAAYPLKFNPVKTATSKATFFKALQAIDPSLEPQTYLLVLNFTDKQGLARTVTRLVKVIAHDYGTQDLGLSGDLASLADHTADDFDNAQLAEAYATFSPAALWQGKWQWPLNVPWTQATDFAQRRTFNGKLDTLYFHDGIDLAPNSGANGANVQVGAAGKVIYTGSLQARGLSVAIDHGLGVTSYYFHLSQINVKVGQTLQNGDIVGLVGSTGRSTGPHLHWEVRVNGLITDPRNFLEEDLSR